MVELVASDLFVADGPGDSHFRGNVGDRASGGDTLDKQPPSVHGQPGVTVVHEDLRCVVKT